MLIVVMEDDFELRASLSEVLREEGYQVEAFSNGRVGLTWLQAPETPSPRLIVLDLMMPEVDGWEFLRFRSQTSRLMAVPVLVLSGHRRGNEKPGALERGVRFAQKPIQLDEFLRLAKELCTLAHPEGEGLK